MPYIKQKDRQIFEGAIQELNSVVLNPGELNYIITRLIHGYVNVLGLSYTHLNDVLGALEGSKLEFYRRVVVPYEQEKIKENGDV